MADQDQKPSQTRKVVLIKCRSYKDDLEQKISHAFQLLGGIGRFIKPGINVLIKPNLLTDKYPDDAVTTHPEIIRAAIRVLKSANCNIKVGDSPANVVKIERVWEKTGLTRLCKEEDVPLLNLGASDPVTFDSPAGQFNIAKTIFESDVILNMPKVKTHSLTTLTAAVKNMYGTVPGFHKAMLHKSHPNNPSFSRLIAEILKKTKPHLSLADGIIGMHGAGPSAGQPVKMNFIALSEDPVAMDIIICEIMGIAPKKVRYLVNLTKDHGGIDEYRKTIEIVGNSIIDLEIEPLKIPNTVFTDFIPAWLAEIIGPLIWVRPVINDKCIHCGRCVKACPVTALSIEPGQKPLLTTPGRCISCCCCHEICPEKAINMTLSPLLRLVRGKDLT